MPQNNESVRINETTAMLMNVIGRMVNTIYHTRNIVNISFISEYDELYGAISYLFPFDESSAEEIDSILSHPSFNLFNEFCKERNIDIKLLLNNYANNLDSVLKNNPIVNAITMSERLS